MKYSILDLCPVPEGSTAADAMRNTADLAQHAESLGYHRYWMAEHHNMPGIASAATAVLLGHVAGKTKTIRVGAGGIMLPNHAPLTIAEQFGTLATLYGDRIDLGLGRAPRAHRCRPIPVRAPMCRSGSSAPRSMVRNWRRISGCLMHSPRISRLTRWRMRRISIAVISSRLTHCPHRSSCSP